MIPGWKEDMNAECLRLLKASPAASPSDLAERLGVSECCAVYVLTELAREGRLRVKTVELVKEGELPCAGESFARCQRKALCPALSRAL